MEMDVKSKSGALNTAAFSLFTLEQILALLTVKMRCRKSPYIRPKKQKCKALIFNSYL